jgi:hypothetical protein
MLFSLLIPAVPPLVDAPIAPPAMVVQAVTTTSNPNMTLGDCVDVQTPDNPNGQLGGGVSPAATLQKYWYLKYHEKLSIRDAKVTVLEGSQHGAVYDRSQPTASAFGPYFEYGPNRGYLGEDKIAFLVEVDGKSVKVVTTLYVVPIADSKGVYCFGDIKRINSIDTPSIFTDLDSWLTTQLDGKFASDINVTFANLAGGTVGQTIGVGANAAITLDDNAAGKGWFIDTTPADNSESSPPPTPTNGWRKRAVPPTARWTCSVYCSTRQHTALPTLS